MSFKAKDLSYDNTQPAFLRRLRGQMAGDGSGRHEVAVPRNKKLQKDDEDDAPTYVMEGTNQSLTKAEFEALQAEKDSERKVAQPHETDEFKVAASDATIENSAVQPVKPTKKRKAAKVIAEENAVETENPKPVDANVVKKVKKKGKPVKLSFGDEEVG